MVVIDVTVLMIFAVDLISIDRHNKEKEAECLERARGLAALFWDRVKGTEDFIWKPDESSSPALRSTTEPMYCTVLYQTSLYIRNMCLDKPLLS